MAFKKLVRYEYGGESQYGDLISSGSDGFLVKRLKGSVETGFSSTSDEPVTITKLLCPIERTPVVMCVGLNYKKHAEEAALTIPQYPVIFMKPADALIGSDTPIPVHPGCQSMLDYEGELTVIISRDCKNLPTEFALEDVVLGYTVGNDVSARNFQLPAVSGGQFCYAKSFDGFAPIGPAIVAPALVPDPQALHYVTRVNGEVRQQTGTDDMYWSVKQIIHHLTQGTTLRAGTVIMTGTPSGVGYFQNRYLKEGDVVEVEIEGFEKLRNVVKFE